MKSNLLYMALKSLSQCLYILEKKSRLYIGCIQFTSTIISFSILIKLSLNQSSSQVPLSLRQCLSLTLVLTRYLHIHYNTVILSVIIQVVEKLRSFLRKKGRKE